MMFRDLYCNPIPLPDMPRGFACRFPEFSSRHYIDGKMDFRELADPEAVYHEGKCYLYPSGRQVYVSEDLIHWEYQDLEIDHPLGYAPTVTRNSGRFLLSSCKRFDDDHERIYSGPTPLGPFRSIGRPCDRKGRPLFDFVDPMLFSDDDGRLYLYWGCAPAAGGIYCMELDPENPVRGIGEIVKVIEFDPSNEWEHYGEYGERTHFGWDEGASMFKYNGEYYLQYSACGTQFRRYSIAVYRGKSPMGPFRKPARPMLRRNHGIINGTGHGGMFAGPNGQIWQVYTTLIRRVHALERRIALDPVVFDSEGNPHVTASSSPRSVSRGETGLIPVSVNKITQVSSRMFGLGGGYAVDECAHTCWAPLPEDTHPSICVDLAVEIEIAACRIIWAELNLDYKAGLEPEPIRFRIHFYDGEHHLMPRSLDYSENRRDLNVEFLAFEPVRARYVKLEILKGGSRLHIGVTDFSIFAFPRP